VANLTETCDPENELQLITKVQAAANNTDDSQLLAEALPNLKARTDLEKIYTDGGHGGPTADKVLQEQQVGHIQTAIRGRSPNPDKLQLADFALRFDDAGKPVKVTCPQEQTLAVQTSSRQKAFVAHFATAICQTCPLAAKCPARPGQRDPRHHLRFTQAEAQMAERRRRSQEHRQEGCNLRAAIEATVRSVKHPFPAGKLPVRGKFRVACLMIGSAAIANIRRIHRYQKTKRKAEYDQKRNADGRASPLEGVGRSFFAFADTLCAVLYGLISPHRSVLGW